MEKVFFKNSKGNKLSAILSKPLKNKNNTVVVMAHGFQSSKDSKKFVEFEKIFNDKNIATFRFDFYGHGESEGAFEQITMSEAKDDALSAISYIKELGFTHIFLIGSSFGGLSSNLATSQSSDLSGLALICPVSDYEEVLREKMTDKEIIEWEKKGFTYVVDEKTHKKRKLLWTFFEDIKKNNGYVSAKNITIPTVIVHGDKDVVVPIAQSKKLAAFIANAKFVVIKGAGHYFETPSTFLAMLQAVSDFIIQESKK